MTASARSLSPPPRRPSARSATCSSRRRSTPGSIELKSPILTNEEFAKLKHIDLPGFKSVTFPILFKVADGPPGLEKAMDELCRQVSQAIEDGINVVVLSDRGVNKEWAPIPSLLAVAGVHHHLIREGTRTRVGLVLESGEPREVHHFSLLIGYGCGAINPYLAFETLDDMMRQGLLTGMDHKTACKNYLKAAMKGVVKVISKMGISTIQSYWGAQIFEAVGLKQSFIDKYFTWTPSRIEGVGIEVIAQEVLLRHQRAFPDRAGQRARARRGRPIPVARGRRVSPVQSADDPQAASRGAHRQLQGVQGIFRAGQRAEPELVHAARLARLQESQAGSHRGGRVGREHHEALQVRRDELRLDQPGSARDARHRHEPHRRQEQHRRRRRRPGTLCAAAQRRLEEQRHQAGRLGPLRRHQRIPGQRQGAADQDGPGRQAGRRRPVARAEGLSLDRQGPLLDAGRRPDLAAAAPRHLLDRGPGRADPRPEERQPSRAHQRQAGVRSGRRHRRRRRRQGARGRGAHQRLRRRHGRLAADRHQARGHPVGTRPGRDPPDPACSTTCARASSSRPTAS